MGSDRVNLARWDGHTHTQFCPHGSREPTEQFIQRAIEKGFRIYSLTEHPPLPNDFHDPTPDQSCGMRASDLEAYLEHALALKIKYSRDIEVRVGLEIDYIPGFEPAIRDLLRSVGSQLDDALLSVHFLPGKGGWRCIDYSSEDFQDGLVDVYGSVEAVHDAYWKMITQAIQADLGPCAPRRIGHLSLINKFQLKHPLPNPDQFRPEVVAILDLISEEKVHLDLDAAGLFKPDCRETYPAPWIIAEALKRKIEFVFGSDTHSVNGVGKGFDQAQQILDSITVDGYL